jgi:3-dehydroquinate synthase
VAFVQVPTTLLAQVDAAVGGKTGVNLAAGKNLVGAFHQPRAVVADVTTLSTLGEREFRAGLGEVIKYGLGLDAELFEWLEEAMPSLLQRDSGALEDVVYWCCALKAGVVAEDERESGRRMLLNLGHTFGHAMETATGYGAWLHGEAVAAGLVAAGRLARRLGRLSDGELERLEQLVAAAGLPADPPPVGSALIRHYMDLDKKIAGGRLRLVLPRGIGAAEIAEDVHEALVAEVLAAADVP